MVRDEAGGTRESRKDIVRDEVLVTFGVPCYNSASYMDRCIQSILDACLPMNDFQIVIVDDGSTKDDTAEKADAWSSKYPGIIDVVHQENGGHGIAVLTGLSNARGIYYKVVDSDDWIDVEAMRKLLVQMKASVDSGNRIDLFITNYVYEHVNDSTSFVVDYRSVLPEGSVFSWEEMKSFRPDQNLLMHSLTYRTEILLKHTPPLPAHTFYVDNIYAWAPLPHCDRMFYCDADLYRYYIGREDQSVNEKVMVSRYDQQIKITRIMIDQYHLFEDVHVQRLRDYMLNYLTMMMTAATIFGRMSEEPESDEAVEQLWDHLKTHDIKTYKNIRHHHILGVFVNLPGKVGKKISMAGYRIARKIFKFN